MNQSDRIARMEACLNESAAALAALEKAVERSRAALPAMESLFSYYFSAQWHQDYADDCAGRLPEDLPRGVLSQDAVYDLFTSRQALMKELASLSRALRADPDDAPENDNHEPEE